MSTWHSKLASTAVEAEDSFLKGLVHFFLLKSLWELSVGKELVISRGSHQITGEDSVSTCQVSHHNEMVWHMWVCIHTCMHTLVCSELQPICLLWFFCFGLFLVFRDRVSLYSPGCPGTHFVDQVGLELRNPPASASRVLGLKACATTPGFAVHFLHLWYVLHLWYWLNYLMELDSYLCQHERDRKHL